MDSMRDHWWWRPGWRASAEVTVRAVSLIDLNQDHRMYEWTDIASVRLGRS